MADGNSAKEISLTDKIIRTLSLSVNRFFL
jgi:hypothetical protein